MTAGLVSLRVSVRSPLAASWLLEHRRDLGAGEHPEVALLVADDLGVEHAGDLARPGRVRLRDEVPRADAPVVPAVGEAVLLGGGAEEDHRPLGLVVAHLHRLGDDEAVDDRRRVVEAALEPGVVMAAEDHVLAWLRRALDLADHVVALAAVGDELERSVELDGGGDGADLESLLEAVAVASTGSRPSAARRGRSRRRRRRAPRAGRSSRASRGCR